MDRFSTFSIYTESRAEDGGLRSEGTTRGSTLRLAVIDADVGCMMTGSKGLASRLLIEGPNTYTISYVKLMWLSKREISRSYTQCVFPRVGSMLVKNSMS
jgi:hypothetical protein